MRGHADPHTLALWAGGDLDRAAAPEVASHIDNCSECRQNLQELERAQAALRDAFAEPSEMDLQEVRCTLAARLDNQRKRERWSWSLGAVFASFVLVSLALMQRDAPRPATEREAVQLPPVHVPVHLALNIPEI